MKKINVLLSVLVLAISTLTPMASFAEVEPEDTTLPNDKIELSTTQASSYKIVVPPGTTTLEKDQKFEVKASAILEYNKELTVSVTSTNNWHLQDTANAENKISYQMKYGDTILNEAVEDILTVPSGNVEHSITLTVVDIETAKHAGTYKDVLTFTAKTTTPDIENSSKPSDAGNENSGA